MHPTDARHDDRPLTDGHATDRVSTRRAFWAVVALIVGCSSSDDVVAEVEPTALPSQSGTVVVGGGTFAPVNAGAGVPAIVGSNAAAPRATAPGVTGPSGTATAPVSLLPLPPATPAIAGALFVSGTPRAVPGAGAQRWPFLEPLRQVFGVPSPGAPSITLQVTDPLAIQTLRELGGVDGLSPILDPALVIVVDATEDRYDLAIWDSE
jgi:hypothetical protein